MPGKPHLLAISPLPEFLAGPLREQFTYHELHAQSDREAFLRDRGVAARRCAPP
jgi:hypothetical protein